ncbi:hypothetical protein [Arcicella rigui]|uniref:Uncharacterized protein n=1 Tax=Arcicella rigui TaxID=797020 RepID=A0ABU5Q5Z3_9BACT|nr:hypothetical protein [Arcicella rigui]MEA5138216.1 hypothetical protein [Arcicella rigui]
MKSCHIIFLVISSIIGFYFNNYASKEANENIQYQEKFDDLIKKDTIVSCNCSNGINSVKIKSKYLIYKNLLQDSIFVVNQKLVFLINNKEIGNYKPPFLYSYVSLNGKKVKVLRTILAEAKCLENNSKHIIYSFYGFNTFDPEHEFFSLNSAKGNWLWYFYGDKYETYKKYGNQSKYIKKYGAKVTSLSNMVKVFPF